ncbi:MAG: hypothetical protein NTY48_01640 [Candidatus Diapherotrites archaeon]|nr:hypothetical protein [Candidatus Diapherotrites archaeon]
MVKPRTLPGRDGRQKLVGRVNRVSAIIVSSKGVQKPSLPIIVRRTLARRLREKKARNAVK